MVTDLDRQQDSHGEAEYDAEKVLLGAEQSLESDTSRDWLTRFLVGLKDVARDVVSEGAHDFTIQIWALLGCNRQQNLVLGFCDGSRSRPRD